jgi:hypothetical protein
MAVISGGEAAACRLNPPAGLPCLQAQNRWRLHPDVTNSVDELLQGQQAHTQVRAQRGSGGRCRAQHCPAAGG